ncbi:hypothetical protein Btru_012708 [Bulinus truncatus]|nr:hypothetical protein Btru_012708 [Bulinus truncatus]
MVQLRLRNVELKSFNFHHRIETMLRVQQLLRDLKLSEAVALFRAAREVWPERNEFGSDSMSQEEELLALREVFMAILPRKFILVNLLQLFFIFTSAVDFFE